MRSCAKIQLQLALNQLNNLCFDIQFIVSGIPVKQKYSVVLTNTRHQTQ